MTKFTDYRWLALFFGAFFFLSGCQAGLAGTDQRIYPETYGLLVSSLDQQEMTMDLDLNSPGVQKYVSGPLPQGLDNDACLFFFWDFDIPDFFKNTPLLLFVPATPYPLEIRVNGYLVFSSGVMNSNTRLDKYYGGFCCKKLLMSDTSPFWH
ncbi:MAG: hypothetical protein HUK40_23360 [Desulfobacter sp.]|nr:hypothetical protein [Desulfobacter sp.]